MRKLIPSLAIFALVLISPPATAAPPTAVYAPGTEADCPLNWSGDVLAVWRATLINSKESFTKKAEKIERCFPSVIPACLNRIREYGTQGDTADYTLDPAAKDEPRRRPPVELLREP